MLINNAGIYLKDVPLTTAVARETLNTNYDGLANLTHGLLPLIKEGGRIVNVSSSMGRLSLLNEALKEKLLNENVTEEQVNGVMDAFVEAADSKSTNWPDNGNRTLSWC